MRKDLYMIKGNKRMCTRYQGRSTEVTPAMFAIRPYDGKIYKCTRVPMYCGSTFVYIHSYLELRRLGNVHACVFCPRQQHHHLGW